VGIQAEGFWHGSRASGNGDPVVELVCRVQKSADLSMLTAALGFGLTMNPESWDDCLLDTDNGDVLLWVNGFPCEPCHGCMWHLQWGQLAGLHDRPHSNFGGRH